MAKKKLSESEQVTAHIQLLQPAMAEIVEKLRATILATDKTVSEHIKWNAPAFYYNGEMKAFDAKEYKRDIVVMNIRNNKLLLVFPTGARIKETDAIGILEGSYTDGRRIVSINNMDEAMSKLKGLQGVIKNWLKGVEK